MAHVVLADPLRERRALVVCRGVPEGLPSSGRYPSYPGSRVWITDDHEHSALFQPSSRRQAGPSRRRETFASVEPPMRCGALLICVAVAGLVRACYRPPCSVFASPQDLSRLEHRLLTSKTAMLDVDFLRDGATIMAPSCSEPRPPSQFPLVVNQAGRADAVAVWFDLWLDEERGQDDVVSTRPEGCARGDASGWVRGRCSRSVLIGAVCRGAFLLHWEDWRGEHSVHHEACLPGGGPIVIC